MNAPPPLLAACTGKRRKFPSPTAFPAMARIRPMRVPHCSFPALIGTPCYRAVGRLARWAGAGASEASLTDIWQETIGAVRGLIGRGERGIFCALPKHRGRLAQLVRVPA